MGPRVLGFARENLANPANPANQLRYCVDFDAQGYDAVSVSLASQASEMASIRELQIWMAEHLETRLSVEDLAERMSMSVRNFERVFTREVGTTPSQYVLQMRVEAARRLLERTDGGLKHVASTAGFGSVDVMRRAFVRLLGITPRRYRELAEQSIGD